MSTSTSVSVAAGGRPPVTTSAFSGPSTSTGSSPALGSGASPSPVLLDQIAARMVQSFLRSAASLGDANASGTLAAPGVGAPPPGSTSGICRLYCHTFVGSQVSVCLFFLPVLSAISHGPAGHIFIIIVVKIFFWPCLLLGNLSADSLLAYRAFAFLPSPQAQFGLARPSGPLHFGPAAAS